MENFEVVELFRHDTRIGKYVRDNVQSPVLAEYLVDALLENNGTLMVARLLVGALAPYLHTAGLQVGRNDVIRLGVHNDDENVIGYLSLALKEIEPGYIDLSRDLAYSLQFDSADDTTGAESREHHLPLRSAVSQDAEDRMMYIRIFLCAFAMCKRLETDPRQPKQAVVASSRG